MFFIVIPHSLTTCFTRCLRGKKECVFVSQQPRRRRGRESKTRVAQMETKLDGLIALLGQSQKLPETTITSPYQHDQEADVDGISENPYDGQVSPQVQYKASSLPPVEPREPSTAMNEPEAAVNVAQRLFAQGLLTYEKAQKLLSSFRNMAQYFPFVMLPLNVTAYSMSQERPFLLLAVLAAASSSEKSLQKTFDHEFRSTLCAKVVMEGEKSIDLLQGLLVHLAWYHFYYIPRNQQSYQFLQIAIGMTIDLGLDQKPWKARAHKVGIDLSHYDQSTSENSDGPLNHEFYGRDARRCYLGCYYLSTAIAIGFKKPNNLKYTEYMIQCAVSLQEEIEYPSDMSLLYLVRLQRIAEEVYGTFHLDKLGSHLEMEQLRLQAYVRTYKSQLMEWKVSLPPDIQRSPIMDMGYHLINVSVHEMGLLYCLSGLENHPIATPEPSFTASIRLNILFSCLEASRSYFECLLSLPAAEYRNFSFVEWGRLIYATFVLYKLSIGPSAIPEWDVKVARNTAKLEIFLESLCYRLQCLSPPKPVNPQKSDLFSMYRMIFENVRSTYLHLKDQPPGNVDEIQPHVSFSTPDKQSPKLQRGPCPAFPYMRRDAFGGTSDFTNLFEMSTDISAALPDDHEFWSSMMADMPEIGVVEF